MVLAILFAIFSFLISTWGIFCILLGLLSFIGLPFISTATTWKGPANFFLRLGAWPITRSSFVVSESNDAYFKQLTLTALGLHTVDVDGDEKVVEDPDSALHYWLGMRFSFVDEEHGVMFDPRHAAVGMRKRAKEQANEGVYLATEQEWESDDIQKWLPGVFEMPTKNELVNLSAVQALIDGGERSEFAKRVEQLYQHSRDPLGSDRPPMKLLFPVIALIAPFAGIWFMVSQFGLPGGPSTTVGYGALFMLAGREVEKKHVAVFGAVLTVVGILAGITVLLNPIVTVAVVLSYLLGLLVLPLLTVLAKPSALLAGAISTIYFKLGFFGYRQPVIEWTPRKYVTRELDDLDTTSNIEYYDQWGHQIGVTYEPGPESWGAEPVSHGEIEAQQMVTDGGASATQTNLPPKYVASSQIKRGQYGGYLPKRVKDDHYYIDSGIAMERFKNSSNGEKAHRKLLQAKDEHGASNSGLSDATVFKASLVTGSISFLAGIGIFVVPAFL